MPKKELSFTDKFKNSCCIILTIIALGTSAFAIEKYFAKTSDVQAAVTKLDKNDQSLNQRIEIGIIDDQIFQQEQEIQRIEDWQRYAQRKEKTILTPIERDTLEKAKTRKAKLEKRKEDKIKEYENGNGNH